MRTTSHLRAFFHGVAWSGCFFFSLLTAHCSLLTAEELKVGYVDVASVFDNYLRTKESEQRLQQEGVKTQAGLEQRLGELKKLRESLELLSDQSRDAKLSELEQKSDEFQQLRLASERKLLRERDQVAREILDEIDQAVKDYAKANGFALILDERSLLYGQDAHDLTSAVLQLLNQRYAAQSSKKP